MPVNRTGLAARLRARNQPDLADLFSRIGVLNLADAVDYPVGLNADNADQLADRLLDLLAGAVDKNTANQAIFQTIFPGVALGGVAAVPGINPAADDIFRAGDDIRVRVVEQARGDVGYRQFIIRPDVVAQGSLLTALDNNDVKRLMREHHAHLPANLNALNIALAAAADSNTARRAIAQGLLGNADRLGDDAHPVNIFPNPDDHQLVVGEARFKRLNSIAGGNADIAAIVAGINADVGVPPDRSAQDQITLHFGANPLPQAAVFQAELNRANDVNGIRAVFINQLGLSALALDRLNIIGPNPMTQNLLGQARYSQLANIAGAHPDVNADIQAIVLAIQADAPGAGDSAQVEITRHLRNNNLPTLAEIQADIQRELANVVAAHAGNPSNAVRAVFTARLGLTPAVLTRIGLGDAANHTLNLIGQTRYGQLNTIAGVHPDILRIVANIQADAPGAGDSAQVEITRHLRNNNLPTLAEIQADIQRELANVAAAHAGNPSNAVRAVFTARLGLTPAALDRIGLAVGDNITSKLGGEALLNQFSQTNPAVADFIVAQPQWEAHGKAQVGAWNINQWNQNKGQLLHALAEIDVSPAGAGLAAIPAILSAGGADATRFIPNGVIGVPGAGGLLAIQRMVGEARLEEFAATNPELITYIRASGLWTNANKERVGAWTPDAWRTNKASLIERLAAADVHANAAALSTILGGAVVRPGVDNLLPAAPPAPANLAQAQTIVANARVSQLNMSCPTAMAYLIGSAEWANPVNKQNLGAIADWTALKDNFIRDLANVDLNAGGVNLIPPVLMQLLSVVPVWAPATLLDAQRMVGEARLVRYAQTYPNLIAFINQDANLRNLIAQRLGALSPDEARDLINGFAIQVANAGDVAAIRAAFNNNIVNGVLVAPGQPLLQAPHTVAAAAVLPNTFALTDAIARTIRGEARREHWVLHELNRLDPRQQHTELRTLLMTDDVRNALGVDLAADRNEAFWRRQVRDLGEESKDLLTVQQASNDLGIANAADNSKRIYAESQKLRVTQTLENAGYTDTLHALTAPLTPLEVNSIARLSPQTVGDFVRDISNSHSTVERLTEVFKSLGAITRDVALATARTLFAERNEMATKIDAIISPLWRRFFKEIGVTWQLTQPQIDAINGYTPGVDIQADRAFLDGLDATQIGLNHLVDAAGNLQPAATRIWPGAANAGVVHAALVNEKARIDSYAPITNPLVKQWLTNTETAPIIAPAMAAKLNNWFANPAFYGCADGGSYTAFKDFLRLPANVGRPLPANAVDGCGFGPNIFPTREQFTAMRRNSTLLAPDAAVYNQAKNDLTNDISAIDKVFRAKERSMDDLPEKVRELLDERDYAPFISNVPEILNDQLYQLREFKNLLTSNRNDLLSLEAKIKDIRAQLPHLEEIDDADPDLPALKREIRINNRGLLSRDEVDFQAKERLSIQRALIASGVAPANVSARAKEIRDLIVRLELTQLDLSHDDNSLLKKYEQRITQVADMIGICETKLAALNTRRQALAAQGDTVNLLSDVKPILVAPGGAGLVDPNEYTSIEGTFDAAIATLLRTEVTAVAARNAAFAAAPGAVGVGAAPTVDPVETIKPLPANTQWVVGGVRDETGELVGAIAVSRPLNANDDVNVKPIHLSNHDTMGWFFKSCQAVGLMTGLNEPTAKRAAEQAIASAIKYKEEHPDETTYVKLPQDKPHHAKLILKYLNALNCPFPIKNIPKMSTKEYNSLKEESAKIKKTIAMGPASTGTLKTAVKIQDRARHHRITRHTF